MKTYGHVIEELDEAPRISAEDTITTARPGQKLGRAGPDRQDARLPL
jgi:hypothetical protein